MTQGVWCHALRDPGLLDVLSQQSPGAHPAQWGASSVEEEHPLPAPPLEPRPQLAEIDGAGAHGAATDRHQALLAPLPHDAHQQLIQNEILHAQRDPFRYAEAGAIRQLEHRPVAKGEWLIQRDGGEQPLDLLHRQHVGERAPRLRSLEALARIDQRLSFGE
jgi:hypothetical protein